MYTLVTGFYKYLTQKDEYNILILGLDNAGKTVRQIDHTIHAGKVLKIFKNNFQTYLEKAKATFTKNYRGMNPAKITTTVGLNIGEINVEGVTLSFWDLGGQQELQALWDKVQIHFSQKF